MAKGIMVVQAAPADPACEAEFNDWYDNTHLAEVLAVPGFVAGERYRAHMPDGGAGPTHPYLAIYHIDADDLAAPPAELRARPRGGRFNVVGRNPPPIVGLYEQLPRA
jgi:hypothetical protein